MEKWHKSHHHRKKSDWKTKALILIIILAFFGHYTGALKIDNDKFNLDIIKEKLNTINRGMESCEGKARALFPEKITLNAYGEGWNWIALDVIDLKKGRLTSKLPIMASFKKGEEAGQNVNLYYYDPGSYSENSLTYSKEIIAEDGTILGTRTFQADLVLKMIPNTEKTIKRRPDSPLEYTTMDFEIVELEIFNCNWLEE